MCYVTVKYVQFVDVCTEFNVAGGVIQGQNKAVCNENFPKCDKLYNSMDAFKCKFIFQSASFNLNVIYPYQRLLNGCFSISMN